MSFILEGWKVVENHHLVKTYKFKDFKAALALTNAFSQAAEQLNHHPDITLKWGEVTLKIYTHEVEGLTEKDKKLAKACDAIYETFPQTKVCF